VSVLRPYPFSALVRRMFAELESRDSIFELPRRKFFLGDARHDYSCRFHGIRASTPLGPAAGPHSQMAQNLVLSWLVGCRILELKTVQIKDELVIPRPCIDMETVGYNIEWSQELKLEESLEEYVKGAMLIEMLKASGRLPFLAGSGDTIYDLSVGYDLDGIGSERVTAFIRGMMNARPTIERLRREIPIEFRTLRDLDFPERLASTATLSTFHGCPPQEIERIMESLLREHRLHSIVKLNPMLLSKAEARRLLHGVLGYDDIRIPDSAFERDATWDEACGFIERLSAMAHLLGLGFGVKLTNTLIVENHRSFFPSSEKEMYLSGPPLHVLSMNLALRIRERFGPQLPISFSAGIDRANFPDAVALGLLPITVCTDLLKPGGYARAALYWDSLASRMDQAGAKTLEEFILNSGGSPAASRDEAILRNTRTYVEFATSDPRYAKPANSKPPKKIGRHLALLDCITCDKCIPVCPNAAIFTLPIPVGDLPGGNLVFDEGAWKLIPGEPVSIREKHQIAIFADFCNECGNCDVFCPEDGGPYVWKPTFYGTAQAFEEAAPRNGFYLDHGPALRARIDGQERRLEHLDSSLIGYRRDDIKVRVDPFKPLATINGTCPPSSKIDLNELAILSALLTAVSYQPSWVHSSIAPV
jgi:putative selenate reductase